MREDSLTSDEIRKNWAETIGQGNFSRLLISLVENGGPFKFILAQFIHISQPVSSFLFPAPYTTAVSEIFENGRISTDFVNMIRENSS